MTNKGNKQEEKKHECLSFQEFKERFYPLSSKQELVSLDTPYELGAELAQKSIIKLKRSLSK